VRSLALFFPLLLHAGIEKQIAVIKGCRTSLARVALASIDAQGRSSGFSIMPYLESRQASWTRLQLSEPIDIIAADPNHDGLSPFLSVVAKALAVEGGKLGMEKSGAGMPVHVSSPYFNVDSNGMPYIILGAFPKEEIVQHEFAHFKFWLETRDQILDYSKKNGDLISKKEAGIMAGQIMLEPAGRMIHEIHAVRAELESFLSRDKSGSSDESLKDDLDLALSGETVEARRSRALIKYNREQISYYAQRTLYPSEAALFKSVDLLNFLDAELAKEKKSLQEFERSSRFFQRIPLVDKRIAKALKARQENIVSLEAEIKATLTIRDALVAEFVSQLENTIRNVQEEYRELKAEFGGEFLDTSFSRFIDPLRENHPLAGLHSESFDGLRGRELLNLIQLEIAQRLRPK